MTCGRRRRRTWRREFDDLREMIEELGEEIRALAVDEATLNAAIGDLTTALTGYIDDVNAGVAAIEAKLAAAGTPVDLSAELAQVQNAGAQVASAKAAFDAAVAPPPA